MNVIGLDGSSSYWKLSGNIAKNSTNKSALHIKTRKLLNELFPTLQILEEVSVPVRKSETLYLDFYLPLKKICIEVHGEQHYKFVQFYHSTILGFVKAKKRDADKKEWCEINSIQYIDLPFNETEDQWRQRILDA
jgi:hypothetical protein